MIDHNAHLGIAIESACEAGAFLQENFGTTEDLIVDEASRHDIKLELDVRSQAIITERLLGAFPDHALYGEEGLAGDQSSPWQWIVDPIDGTVNYFYGIPHFCVSIALRHEGVTQLGVIFDPMTDELWTAVKGKGVFLGGRRVHVSSRTSLAESVVTVGFAKTAASLEEGFASFQKLAARVRKIRIFGSAALGLAYVAAGRLDAYIENFISLWDIAAGVLMVDEAGGRVDQTGIDGEPDKFRIVGSNGGLDLSFLT